MIFGSYLKIGLITDYGSKDEESNDRVAGAGLQRAMTTMLRENRVICQFSQKSGATSIGSSFTFKTVTFFIRFKDSLILASGFSWRFCLEILVMLIDLLSARA